MTAGVALMGWQEAALVFVAGVVLVGLAAAVGSIVVMICRRGKK